MVEYQDGMHSSVYVVIRADLKDYIDDLAKAYNDARMCGLVLCSREKTIKDFIESIKDKTYIDASAIDTLLTSQGQRKHLILYIAGNVAVSLFLQAVMLYNTMDGIIEFLNDKSGYEFLLYRLDRGNWVWDKIIHQLKTEFYQRHYFLIPTSEIDDFDVVRGMNAIIANILQKPVTYQFDKNVESREITDLNVFIHLFTTFKYNEDFLDAVTKAVKELTPKYVNKYPTADYQNDTLSQIVRSVASNDLHVYIALVWSADVAPEPKRLYPATDLAIKSDVEDYVQGTIGTDVTGEGVEYYVISDQETIAVIEDNLSGKDLKSDAGREEAIYETMKENNFINYKILNMGRDVVILIRTTKFDSTSIDKFKNAVEKSQADKVFDIVMEAAAKLVEEGRNVEGLYISNDGKTDRISAYEFNISWNPVYITGAAAGLSTILILLLGR